MRTNVISNKKLKGRAISGTYVVMLAWDFANSPTTQRKGLLGFAIERTEFKNGVPNEKYWMKGIKRFKNKEKGLPPGTPVSTAEHPFQSFQWSDYTAKQNSTYQYRIVPAYGTVKLIDLHEKDALVLNIQTEAVMGDAVAASNKSIRHDLFFNRGIIGSQAYAREFGNAKPDRYDPSSREMVWLSRGLFEALIGFIGLANNERYALRAAVYECHYQPVANAFAKAVEAGADVKIVYDADSDYKVENLETLERAGLNAIGSAIPRLVSEGLRHNKFIVLLEDDLPIGVWTGSTNISAGGIFGHSNVGHVVWDVETAMAYFEYWLRLSENLTPTKIRPLNKAASPLPAGKPPKNSITPVFSPRDTKEENDSLQWYADLMASAKRIMCITIAFNLDEVFQKVIQEDNDVLRYIVKDDNLRDNEIIGQDNDVLFAAGGYFGKNWLYNFLEESENPLNSNDYIHNKFMLIDPLSNDPIVVTGSANFSRPSQRSNDENMLIIRGDTRIADIYFGEFLRMFDHHYARYVARLLRQTDKNDPNAGYLKVTEEWTNLHFDPTSYKAKRRKYFVVG